VRGVRLQDGHTGRLVVSLIEAVRELDTGIAALEVARGTSEECPGFAARRPCGGIAVSRLSRHTLTLSTIVRIRRAGDAELIPV
jgi:hypothetical protein